MRDLTQHAENCMGILDAIGVPYVRPAKWEVNTRAKTRWGMCRKDSKTGTFTIQINADLLDERNEENPLYNTIIHELLHTVPKCMNHGKVWKEYAEYVKEQTGYEIKRCSDPEEKGVTYVTTRPIKYHWRIKCQDCGKEYYYQRKSKAVKNIKWCSCGVCGSHELTVEHI